MTPFFALLSTFVIPAFPAGRLWSFSVAVVIFISISTTVRGGLLSFQWWWPAEISFKNLILIHFKNFLNNVVKPFPVTTHVCKNLFSNRMFFFLEVNRKKCQSQISQSYRKKKRQLSRCVRPNRLLFRWCCLWVSSQVAGVAVLECLLLTCLKKWNRE